MRTSVVIPCHSLAGWPELVAAVESVRAQDPAEIVVAVDHNPLLYQRARNALRGVHVVDNIYTRGASSTRNAGIEHTSTPVVALLDGDAYARPGWLAALTEPFDQPDVVGTGGAIVPMWRGHRPGWFPDEFLWTVGGSFPASHEGPAPTRNVWSASMAVRRDAFDAVGGFRDGFGKQGRRARPEDTELCLRVAAMTGGHWMYVPAAQIEHPVPVDRARFRAFLSRCYQEGRGKVEMARLVGDTGESLRNERTYLRRTLPVAVGRGLAATARGRGARHAAAAGATVLGVLAAGVGGGVEALHGTRPRAAAPLVLRPAGAPVAIASQPVAPTADVARSAGRVERTPAGARR
jgi:glucosyl-dolichyl phosphate glucuronosyltransferase